jgi:hypothetical protein
MAQPVAVRAPPSIAAISPKNPPGPIVSTVLPPRSIPM